MTTGRFQWSPGVGRAIFVPLLQQTYAAIDVGTNAVRLLLARPRRDGTIETLHEERDPVRPGEGVFRTGAIPAPVAERLLGALRRYGAIGRRAGAIVRAVATSAIREARNRADILARVRTEAGFELEVISGREEARLICLGVLQGAGARTRSIVVDIGGGSTEVAVATGEEPTNLYSMALGAVRLTELFESDGPITRRKLALMREYAANIAGSELPPELARAARRAIGSSGTIRAVISMAATPPGSGHATPERITETVDELAAMTAEQRRRRFDPARAEIIVAGAVVLEAVARRLKLTSIAATDRGLRDGLILDLWRSQQVVDRDLSEVAIAVGTRFAFDRPHAEQVTRLALALFDTVAKVVPFPRPARSYLEVAALLHDIGHAVGHQKHHRHTAYLIEHTDLPGLTDHERQIVARVARYHRRSAPEVSHIGMEGLTLPEARLVRRLASILRVADALDQSHHQLVTRAAGKLADGAVVMNLRARGPLDLELWDVEHEVALFRRVFNRKLVLRVTRA